MSPQKPEIIKRGTIDVDMVETTPFVYKDKLYRFESVRVGHPANTGDESYFRLLDVEAKRPLPSFGAGHHLGCAYADDTGAYIYGVPQWGASTISVFWSSDLENWQQQTALATEGWGIYNTTVCKSPEGYTMAFEVGEPPEVAGYRFTIFFAHSKDLLNWTQAPFECVYSREKYTACPALRYYDGFYYMIYVEHKEPDWYFVPHIVRSRDLCAWEESPLNPVLEPSDADRQIAAATFTPEQLQAIAEKLDINNSDVDFCNLQGKTIINYSWGDQRGTEFFAEAYFEGSEQELLEGFFPG